MALANYYKDGLHSKLSYLGPLVLTKLQSSPRDSAHVFIDIAFRPEDRELTIETLDYPDTYFVKWFTHVCCRGQQYQV
ncbi:hypothetical protein Golob_018699, partial [Gossypium lobatum]|nr:hypothetical protein [Gossypium lobatum]